MTSRSTVYATSLEQPYALRTLFHSHFNCSTPSTSTCCFPLNSTVDPRRSRSKSRSVLKVCSSCYGLVSGTVRPCIAVRYSRWGALLTSPRAFHFAQKRSISDMSRMRARDSSFAPQALPSDCRDASFLPDALRKLTGYSSRVTGSLLGAACGDILGASVEGWPSLQVAWKHPEGLLQFSDKSDRKFGCYTDDTEMLIGLARSLVKKRTCDAEAAALEYVALFNSERGYGGTAVKILADLKRNPREYATIAHKYIPEGSYGNGGAMRIAPVGLAYRHAAHAVLRSAVKQALLCTHAHPLAIDGALIQAAAVGLLSEADARSSGPDWLLGQLMPLARTDEMRDKLRLLTHHLDEVSDSGSQLLTWRSHLESEDWARELAVAGAVSAEFQIKATDAAACSLWALINHWHRPRDAVVAAVHYGGDTDTLACMTGALAGALHGVSWIPPSWWQQMENGEVGRDYLAFDLAPKLAQLDCK